jgi:hypothetical protein
MPIEVSGAKALTAHDEAEGCSFPPWRTPKRNDRARAAWVLAFKPRHLVEIVSADPA